MKMIYLTATASIAIFLSSCTSTPGSRIQQHPEIYSSLSEKHRMLVRQGVIERGMTKPAVYLAMGHPDRKFSGERYGKIEDRWDYNVYVPVHSYGFGPFYGYGWGHYGGHGYYGAYYHPTVHYVPRRGSSVFFKSHKVIGWNREQRDY